MPLSVPATALTYPTLTWEQYNTPISVAAATNINIPLDGSSDAVLSNPAGWAIAAGIVTVGAGLFTFNWYWEADGVATFFDNYAGVYVDSLASTIYPTAGMAHPDSYWGSTTGTFKLGALGQFYFRVNNVDPADPHGIYSLVTITRLDV